MEALEGHAGLDGRRRMTPAYDHEIARSYLGFPAPLGSLGAPWPTASLRSGR